MQTVKEALLFVLLPIYTALTSMLPHLYALGQTYDDTQNLPPW